MVVVNAAGCGSHLKEADLPVRVVDVNELLAELEPRAERHELPVRVAYQDACHLGHAQGIRDAPREVLRSIPGLELAEPAEQAICCGSAGIYNLVQPAPAAELGERKAANVAASGRGGVREREPRLPGAGLDVSAAVGQAHARRPSGGAPRRVDARRRSRAAAGLGPPLRGLTLEAGEQPVDAMRDLVADRAHALDRQAVGIGDPQFS